MSRQAAHLPSPHKCARDSPSVPLGVTDFHGYGALRVGWKQYLSTLRKTAPFVVTRTKTIKSQLSPDNPFFKDAVFEYKIDIDPVALADNLFDIRMQLAEEWAADLQLIPAENAELFRHHNAIMVNASDDQQAMHHPLIRESRPHASSRCVVSRC